jgi:hypothetical protein
MGEKGNAYRVFFGKAEGKRSLGRPKLGARIKLKLLLEKQDGVV